MLVGGLALLWGGIFGMRLVEPASLPPRPHA